MNHYVLYMKNDISLKMCAVFQGSYTGPVFTKLFRIRIKIRLQLKILLLWTFKPTIILLTIDCW